MKILFLDFDGVLNSTAFFRTRGNRYEPETLDEAAVRRVNAILARTGAKVVVSSTWREGYSIDGLRKILVHHGFAGELVGVTPVLSEVEDGTSIRLHVARGQEIQTWLDAQQGSIDTFVILDDMDDMEHLTDRLVLTSFETGLEDEHVEAAVALLGGS